MTEHVLDAAHWEQLKRTTRARLERAGAIVPPPAPGVHDVEHDTHRTQSMRAEESDVS